MGDNDLRRVQKFFLVVLALAIGCGSLSGCATLRKKFTRKKKTSDQTEDFIPVLQPVEYKKVELPPLEKYKEQYAMARAYFKDVSDTLGSSGSGDKQQVYALNQLAVRLQGMADLLPGEKKAALGEIIVEVRDVVKEYDKAAPMRRYDILKGTMQKAEKRVRSDFKPDAVKNEIKAP